MADVNQELERHIGEDTQISLVDTQAASWRRRQGSSPGGRVGKEAEEETARAKVGLRDSCRRNCKREEEDGSSTDHGGLQAELVLSLSLNVLNKQLLPLAPSSPSSPNSLIHRPQREHSQA